MTRFPVIPAKAGIHLPTVAPGSTGTRWFPAFAGMTREGGR